jgi:hypothetical protein
MRMKRRVDDENLPLKKTLLQEQSYRTQQCLWILSQEA